MVRTGDGDIDALAVQTFDQGISGSLNAVCQWFDDYFGIFMCGKDMFQMPKNEG